MSAAASLHPGGTGIGGKIPHFPASSRDSSSECLHSEAPVGPGKNLLLTYQPLAFLPPLGPLSFPFMLLEIYSEVNYPHPVFVSELDLERTQTKTEERGLRARLRAPDRCPYKETLRKSYLECSK